MVVPTLINLTFLKALWIRTMSHLPYFNKSSDILILGFSYANTRKLLVLKSISSMIWMTKGYEASMNPEIRTCCVLFLPYIYRWIRGHSRDFPFIPKIGRRKVVFQGQEPKIHWSLSDSASSAPSPLPYIFKILGTSSAIGRSGSRGGTSSSSSSQPSSLTSIGSIYIHVVPVQSTTNSSKVIKKYGLFQF